MKKKLTIIFIFTFILFSFSQTIDEVGISTCDCIHNISEDISFDKKFEKCAMPNLAKKITSEKINDYNKVKENIFLLKKYIEDNCEAIIKTNSINEKDLKKLSDNSCDCINKIDYKLKSKFDSVKECISSSLILYQMTNSFKKVNLDSASTAVKPSKVNLIIQTETDSRLYKQLESHLLENCEYLGYIINIDNTKHLNSVSFDRKANEEFEKGNDCVLNKEYDKAIKYFKNAVAIDSKFAFAWDNLGISYRKIGNYKSAIKAYRMSLKANPKGRLPLMNIGVAYNGNKQYKKAVKSYIEFTKRFKDDAEGYFGLGKSYSFLNKNEEALESMIKALRIYTYNKSPYRADAEKMILYIYNNMKNNNNLSKFKAIMKKNNIDFE